MEDSVFSGNQTQSCQGGGLYNGATLTVDGSTFAANSSGSDCYGGGGAYNSGTLTVTNSTFSGNRSGKYGGGIENEGNLSTLAIINSTFSGNESSASGGGIDIFSGILRLKNTIIANSIAESDCFNYAGTITLDVNNLIEDGSCNPALSGDPVLGPLADNGGKTRTHALLPGSPALDQIPAGVDGCGSSIASDQRGIMRPQGDSCDIGAYEAVHFTLTVSLAGDGSGSVGGSGIDCGADCSESYPDGAAITLTASADSGSTFGGWAGACTNSSSDCVVTMDDGKAVTATFGIEPPVTYTLTVHTVGSGTVDPAGGTYISGTVLSLSATPDPEWQFEGWSGGVISTSNPVSITMTRNMTVTATFEQSGHGIYLPLVLKNH